MLIVKWWNIRLNNRCNRFIEKMLSNNDQSICFERWIDFNYRLWSCSTRTWNCLYDIVWHMWSMRIVENFQCPTIIRDIHMHLQLKNNIILFAQKKIRLLHSSFLLIDHFRNNENRISDDVMKGKNHCSHFFFGNNMSADWDLNIVESWVLLMFNFKDRYFNFITFVRSFFFSNKIINYFSVGGIRY